jgi:hypothetical protein
MKKKGGGLKTTEGSGRSPTVNIIRNKKPPLLLRGRWKTQ